MIQRHFQIAATALIVLLGLVDGKAALVTAQEVQVSEFKIWPNGLPAGATEFSKDRIEKLLKEQGKGDQFLSYVEQPSLMVFQPPADKANGCAVIICPGGGYNRVYYKHEGTELAKWFNSLGVTAFVLKYRIPRRTEQIHWEPMQDVQRAIRVVRHDAEKWKIDPQRLGVMGFSAGGHLTVMAGLHSATKCYDPTDDADQESAKPNFICPIYAAYLGNGYRDNKAELGDLIDVPTDAPPTFMAVTWDDTMRGAQAALLFARLKQKGVSAELHAYASGGHGYGIRKTGKPVSNWNLQLKAWMESKKLLQASGIASDE
jgi:acetyl esterase/lipase